MFDNSNPYTLRMELIEGIMHYYIFFADGQAISREIEVSRPVYLEFCRFVKRERNLRRWDERHIEQSDLKDETLYNRALFPPKNVDEAVFDNLRDENLRRFIAKLPEIQQRRFILHYELGLSCPQISEMEGCSTRAIEYSISIAKEKVKKFFEN